jgi:uncharacterized protein YggE
MKPIRIVILVVLGAAVVALAGVGRPESAGGAAKPTEGITVTGTGTVKTVPNEAEFSIGVQTNGETAREALAKNSAQMRGVLAAIRAAGIAKDDVKTQDVSVSPSYANGGRVSGYSAHNSVSVHIRDLSKAGAVLDGATKAGASEVYGPALTRSDRQARQADALRSAVADARSKAQALADAADVRLGGVTSISEGSDSGVQPYFAQALASTDARVPIQPGKEDIQASVTVTFAIS